MCLAGGAAEARRSSGVARGATARDAVGALNRGEAAPHGPTRSRSTAASASWTSGPRTARTARPASTMTVSSAPSTARPASARVRWRSRSAISSHGVCSPLRCWWVRTRPSRRSGRSGTCRRSGRVGWSSCTPGTCSRRGMRPNRPEASGGGLTCENGRTLPRTLRRALAKRRGSVRVFALLRDPAG